MKLLPKQLLFIFFINHSYSNRFYGQSKCPPSDLLQVKTPGVADKWKKFVEEDHHF